MFLRIITYILLIHAIIVVNSYSGASQFCPASSIINSENENDGLLSYPTEVFGHSNSSQYYYNCTGYHATQYGGKEFYSCQSGGEVCPVVEDNVRQLLNVTTWPMQFSKICSIIRNSSVTNINIVLFGGSMSLGGYTLDVVVI
jgi:hypothetical protein